MIQFKKYVYMASMALITNTLAAQNSPENWYNLDPKSDKVSGMSVNKAYTYMGEKKPKPITVAVIDSGTDIDHEDLVDNIWVNADEIPANGIDDDNNGYVDDLHGWNYLGAKDGTPVVDESLEMTRMTAMLRSKYADVDSASLSESQREEYQLFRKLDAELESELKKAKKQYNTWLRQEQVIGMAYAKVRELLGAEEFSEQQLDTLSSTDQGEQQLIEIVKSIEAEPAISEDYFTQTRKHFESKVKYWYNEDFNTREITQDDPTDIRDIDYGNPLVSGPHGGHGTHVAGIIGAVRGNNTGIEGVASNARLMVLRVVPNGDERDKDVALAIRYAVDNGARIINMSFGKNYSPQKEMVDAAYAYAQANNVLLVNAAGNNSDDNDVVEHFPVAEGLNGENYSNSVLVVGANGSSRKKDLVGGFSNYGQQTVDLFAPGVAINSTYPENEYEVNSGTSMAAPAASGVAALVLGYYPHLTAVQLKQVLTESVYIPRKRKVLAPGDSGKVKFSTLSSSGGIINAYNALQYASETFPNP